MISKTIGFRGLAYFPTNPSNELKSLTSVLISVLSQSELPWVLHDIFQGPSTKLRNQTWIALASRMTASVSIQTFTKKKRVGGMPQQKETFESWKCTSQATLLGSFLSLQRWLCATMRSLVQQGRSPLRGAPAAQLCNDSPAAGLTGSLVLEVGLQRATLLHQQNNLTVPTFVYILASWS